MSYEIFEKALLICEEVLGPMSLDHKEAYDFSKQYYSMLPEHLANTILNETEKYKKGKYERDLLRFVFVKSIENRIASDLYSDTNRGNVCDVYFSPEDMDLEKYPTNLPLHLEEIVNRQQQTADYIFTKILDNFTNFEQGINDILLAVFCYAQEYGYNLGQENLTYNSYNCSDMLTRNEIMSISCNNVCSWLEGNNFEISEMNYTRDTYQNIVAILNDKKYYILLSCEIAPTTPGFRSKDLENLYQISKENKATACIISLSIRSSDEKHFKDAIILAGDEIQYRINCFEELLINDSKQKNQKFLSRDIMENLDN